VMDNLGITDLGATSGGATCASIEAPATAELSPGVANQVVTTFTNNEDTEATNIAVSLGALPQGWRVEVAKDKGNLFDAVAPGKGVSTTWLVTPPDDAKGTSVDLTPAATYFNQCATKTATTTTTFTVASRAMVPTGAMTATADSQEQYAGPSEGPVANVLDGDLSTIWHTQYNPTVTAYPHWVQLDLHGTYTVDGFGYQDRQSGGPNGRVKDYKVFVSQDGTTWTQVAAGSLVDQPAVQVVDFTPVEAKFVKFEAENALNGQPFAAAAEMRVYGSSSASASGYPPAPRPGETACTP
jgi:endo-alpha-N-acetylgalactosaminidase